MAGRNLKTMGRYCYNVDTLYDIKDELNGVKINFSLSLTYI